MTIKRSFQSVRDVMKEKLIFMDGMATAAEDEPPRALLGGDEDSM